MAKHSRDSMVVLAAPAARSAVRRRRRRQSALAAAVGSRRGRIGSAAALIVCLAVAVGAGTTLARTGGDPGARDVALVDATPTATTSAPRTTAPATPAPSSTSASVATTAASTTPPAAPATGLAAGGIPVVALQAYQGAAAAMGASSPACGITWPLIASIGRIESNHGRTSGTLLVDGTSNPPVMGILLSGGNGFAVIKDTDGGVYDGNAQYDRAIGPMQFIPSTWKMYASDGNGDGRSDPFNIYDASLAAGKYLCRAGGDLRTGEGLQRAVYSYNHDMSYVNKVLALADEYAVAFNENRLPITAVTDAPAPSDSDLPPANVGGGAEEPAPSQTPVESPGPTDAPPVAETSPSETTPSETAPTTPGETTPGETTSPSDTSGPSDTAGPSASGSPSDSGPASESAAPEPSNS